MLTKNQIYEAVITDYTAEGQGVAKVEGCAVFIPNAIRGEKVRVRIEEARKTWAAGKIVEILEKSPHRVDLWRFWKSPPIGWPGNAPFPPAAAAATSGTWITPRKPP